MGKNNRRTSVYHEWKVTRKKNGKIAGKIILCAEGDEGILATTDMLADCVDESLKGLAEKYGKGEK